MNIIKEDEISRVLKNIEFILFLNSFFSTNGNKINPNIAKIGNLKNSQIKM